MLAHTPHNLACRGLQDTWIVSDEQHGDILWFLFFVTIETRSPFVSTVWEITAMPVSCETPVVYCGLKNFHGHECK